LDYVLAGCSCQIILERFVLAAVDRQRFDSLAAGLQSPHQDKVSVERRSQVFGRRVHEHPSWN